MFHRNGKQIKNFAGSWRKACKAVGVPGKLKHDFRRTAVKALERAGVSRSVAMKLTGHKTESAYRRYAIVSESDLGEGVAKLAAQRARDAAEQRCRETSATKHESILTGLSGKRFLTY